MADFSVASQLIGIRSPISPRNAPMKKTRKSCKICPIEVKSSGYNTHKSLDAFSEKYSERIADKYVVCTKDLRKEKDIVMLPVYLLPFLKVE